MNLEVFSHGKLQEFLQIYNAIKSGEVTEEQIKEEINKQINKNIQRIQAGDSMQGLPPQAHTQSKAPCKGCGKK